MRRGLLLLGAALWAGGSLSLSRPSDRNAAGRKLFEDVCSLCHDLQRAGSRNMSKEEWSGFIKGMLSEGAPLTDEEFSLLVDYLAENFGNKGK